MVDYDKVAYLSDYAKVAYLSDYVKVAYLSDYARVAYLSDYARVHQIMKVRQRPITTPMMMTSRRLRTLILLTRLLITGNLVIMSFKRFWNA